VFMFDSNRTEQLRALTAFYKPGNVIVPIEPDVQLDHTDSFISLPDLREIGNYVVCGHRDSMIEAIRRCFLFFFKDTTYVDNGSFFSVSYKGGSYNIQKNIVKSFFHWQVYNDITKVENVVEDDRTGSCREPVMIASRGSEMDGQLKIMTDAILTVDAVEIKENLKIIIVGSAHDPMPIPRSSYEPLFYMVKNSEFDLYDFVEEEGEGVINTNKVRRHRKPYDYSTLGDYDVLLDDTWYQGEVAFPTFFFE